MATPTPDSPLTRPGFSAVFGPALYIGFMQAFGDEWRHAILIFVPFTLVQPCVWWIMVSSQSCITAEQTRQAARTREAERFAKKAAATSICSAPIISANTQTDEAEDKKGFGPGRTRIGLFWKVIVPQYVVPLLTCTCGAMFVLFWPRTNSPGFELIPRRAERSTQLSA